MLLQPFFPELNSYQLQEAFYHIKLAKNLQAF